MILPNFVLQSAVMRKVVNGILLIFPIMKVMNLFQKFIVYQHVVDTMNVLNL